MRNTGKEREVTRVSSGFNCDGLKMVTYFAGGKEIAKEVLADGDLQLVMTGRIPDGKVLEYYWTGTLHRVFTYANNRAHGYGRTYYPEGLIWMEQHFRKGLLDGPARTFYKSRSIREECTYKRGKLHGEHKSYYESGALDVTVFFNEDKQEGDYRAYFENGMPRESSTYNHGKKEGVSTTYYETGEVRCIDMCLAGRVIQRKRFDEEGRLLFEASEPIDEIEEERTNKSKDHLNRGTDFAAMGCHKQAAEEFEKAMTEDPLNYEAYLKSALTCRHLGFYGDCIDTLNRLLELSPYHLEARFNLAIAHIVTGNRAEALAEYHVLRDIDERYAHGLMNVLESPGSYF
ncbi:MAG: MORN repeat variant [Syntrophorhabdus sp. PtaU1.Bin153]|nr:MAG: MORN repeat variant [Syntrophorhabdus sp. PtaU1.Bin153]